jgi:hypothetical protein
MRHLLAQKPVAKFRYDYASAPVTTTVWVELLAALTQPACAMEIYDGSGKIMKLALAAAGDEDNKEIPYYIIPGGSSILLPVDGLSKGQRLAIKAVDADATENSLIINFFG